MELDERLRERELGAFDGMTGTAFVVFIPGGRTATLAGQVLLPAAGGESWADVVQRVRQFMLNLTVDPTPRTGSGCSPTRR